MQRLTSVFVAAVCLGTAAQAQYNAANLSLKDEVAEERYSFDRLRIYPITANRVFLESHKTVGNYKPLKQGLDDGSVKIIERGAAADIGVAAEEPVLDAVQPYEEVAPLPPVQQVGEEPVQRIQSHNANGHVLMYEQYQAPANQRIRSQSRINEEALNENEIYVQQEIGGGAGDEVNKLFIQNTSKDTVFIMAGEVVKGGKQDRVIAMDMVIPPNSAPVDLSVFCVEHGRWTYSESDAADGFTGHANVANASVRKAAIVEKQQSMVWDKVEEVTTANEAVSATGTLNSLEKDADYQRELREYEAKFSDLPSAAASVIGVVAVTGNRVIGCDMFATPDLFKNAFPDLLKSYASEAITSGAKVTITTAQVNKYISEILDESKQEKVVSEKGQMYQRGVRTLHISTFD